MVDYSALSASYKGKKVFITGHTGFKGTWLMAWLHLLGAKVKGYALEPEKEECIFNSVKPFIIIDSVIGDIRNKETLEEEILSFQPDIIFHLAAQPLVRKSYQIPSETFEINAIGTANLLESVNKLTNKCAVVIITTDKVYENKEADILYKEIDTLGGYDPYSASKACTEIVVNSFRRSFFNTDKVKIHQKAIATARAGNVIGGGDFSEDRIMPDIIRALQKEKTIEIRNPFSIRPWQHVIEPLAGYLLLGSLLYHQPEKYSEAYNFGPLPADHLTVKKLAEIAINNWGNGKWDDIGQANQPHEATLLKLDITKAEKELNWKPRLTAAQAIEWTINWHKKQDIDPLERTIKQIENYIKL